jgi:hypothetical protein
MDSLDRRIADVVTYYYAAVGERREALPQAVRSGRASALPGSTYEQKRALVRQLRNEARGLLLQQFRQLGHSALLPERVGSVRRVSRSVQKTERTRAAQDARISQRLWFEIRWMTYRLRHGLPLLGWGATEPRFVKIARSAASRLPLPPTEA